MNGRHVDQKWTSCADPQLAGLGKLTDCVQDAPDHVSAETTGSACQTSEGQTQLGCADRTGESPMFVFAGHSVLFVSSVLVAS